MRCTTSIRRGVSHPLPEKKRRCAVLSPVAGGTPSLARRYPVSSHDSPWTVWQAEVWCTAGTSLCLSDENVPSCVGAVVVSIWPLVINGNQGIPVMQILHTSYYSIILLIFQS